MGEEGAGGQGANWLTNVRSPLQSDLKGDVAEVDVGKLAWGLKSRWTDSGPAQCASYILRAVSVGASDGKAAKFGLSPCVPRVGSREAGRRGRRESVLEGGTEGANAGRE